MGKVSSQWALSPRKEEEKVMEMARRKVIIVDDEQHICRLIEALIDWEAQGLEVIGFAHDGSDAFLMCQEMSPDFLITDIQMPGLSGIDLIKKLYDECPEIKVIIITGYSQFPYAHQALRYGVIDYLLKPIQKEELEHALQKGMELIDREMVLPIEKESLALRSMREIKANLLTLILQDAEQAPKVRNHSRFIEEYHLKFQGKAWQLLQVEFILSNEENSISVQDFLKDKIKDIVVRELKGDHIEIITALSGNSFFCLLNGDNNSLEQARILLNQVKNKLLMVNDILQKINFTIGISNVCEDFSKISGCVQECHVCIHHKIVKGKNKIIKYSDVPTTELKASYFINDNFRKQFLKGIVDADGEAVSAEINELVTFLYRFLGKIDGDIVLEIYQMLVRIFFKGIQTFSFTDFKEFTQDNLISQKEDFYSISGAFTYLSEIFQMLLKRCCEEKEDQNTQPIRETRLYIEEHYMEQVTLEEIARHVGLNESYLSSIFKKQVGKSLIDYLTYTRVQHARELLINRNKSVNEIAEEVGFNDAKYFTKRFKKYTGVSPNEYRKLFA